MAIQLKRSLTANLDVNYVLADGQVGIEKPSAINSSASPFKMKIGDGSSAWKSLPYLGSVDIPDVDLSGYVPTSRKINNKSLTTDINLTAADVGARPSSWTPSASDVGARPNTWTPTAADVGALSTSGTASSATKLATARTIRTNLASTSTASFDGSSNVTPGVSGTLPVANGGTGVTSIAALKTALGIGSSSSGGSYSLPVTQNGSGDNWRNFYTPSTSGSQDGIVYFTNDTANNRYHRQTGIRCSSGNYGSTSAALYLYGWDDNDYSNKYNFQMSTVLEFDNYSSSVSASFCPSGQYMTTSGSSACELVTLGAPATRWGSVYSKTGSIQTSDASAKHAIHYLSDSSTATVDEDGTTVTAMTLENVIDFINQMEPATFVYNSAVGVATDDPSNRQLGLIANDLENHPLFPYIGGKYTWEAREDRPAGESLALKPIPLATAALTACKYLLQRNELLEERVDTLESKSA